MLDARLNKTLHLVLHSTLSHQCKSFVYISIHQIFIIAIGSAHNPMARLFYPNKKSQHLNVFSFPFLIIIVRKI